MESAAQFTKHFYGAAFVELCVSFVIYGITTAQAWIYWWRYPSDPRYIRWTVLIIWVLESVQTAACIQMMYQYLVADIGDLNAVESINWNAGASIILTAIIVYTVEIFFARRIWILSGRKVIPTAISVVLMTIHTAFSLGSGIILAKGGKWQTYYTEELPFVLTVATLGLAAVTDLTMTLITIFYIRQKRTGFHRTDHQLARVQVYIVNSGGLTMVVSLAVLLAFIFSRDTLLYGGLEETICKLYNNALLATLNARRQGDGDPKSSDTQPQSFELSGIRGESSWQRERPIEILQHVTSDVLADHAPDKRVINIDHDPEYAPEKSLAIV